ASKSPPSARGDTDRSAPATNAVPSAATTMPAHAMRGNRRPNHNAISPAKIGCAHTSAVADATDVMVRLGTQVPKCSARATPAPAAISTPRSDRPRRATVEAAVAATASPAPQALRQNAIARAGAAVAAISGPENDTPAM